MKMCSAKEVWINISRRDSWQCQLFLASVNILKQELYHRHSSQILIISSRTHHVSFLFELFFQSLNCSLDFSVLQFTIKSWATCQSNFNMFLSWIWKTCIIDVPRTSHHLVPGRSRNWVPPTSPFRTFEYLFFQKKKQYICKTRTIAPKKILF